MRHRRALAPVVAVVSLWILGATAAQAAPGPRVAVFVQDVSPAPLADGRLMYELFLRVTDLSLEDTAGARVNVPLNGNPPPPFIDFDLLTLDNTATLLGVGAVPAGTYSKLVFTLDTAGCAFRADAPAPVGPLVPLNVPNPEFEAEFLTPLVVGRDTTSILLDIRPDKIVTVVVPELRYRLAPSVEALAAQAGTALPEAIAVKDVDGFVTAVDCPRFTLNFAIGVETAGARVIDRADPRLDISCGAIAVGDAVAVRGILSVTPAATTLAATRIEIQKGRERP